MRPSLILLFLSYQSFAATLSLESDGYSLSAVIEKSPIDTLAGTIHIAKSSSGDCKGNFTYEPHRGIFSAKFEEPCTKENIDIVISAYNLSLLNSGQSIAVIYRPARFNKREIAGQLKITESSLWYR